MGNRCPVGRIGALLIIMATVGAGEAAGQFCADVPARIGQPALGMGVGFNENATTYGLRFQATPINHLVVDGGYDAIDVEGFDLTHSIQAGAAYERPLGAGLVCPRAALGLSQVLERGDWQDRTSVGVSIGVTIGKEAYSDGQFRLTPFVRAAYSVATVLSVMTDDGWVDSYSAAGGALVFLTDRIFGTGSVSVAEGGNTGASIRLGLLLR